ncbi:MAG: TlpA family protein disulfide reductase [Myxococcales bacterium]|nr:TlpA family protein disulfide reductase [Myxococcales bacterium]
MTGRGCLFALLSLTLPAPALAEEVAAIDKPAPMFRLPVYNAKATGAAADGLHRYVGPDAEDKGAKVLLLSFMASFCKPCKKEMPYLQSLYERRRTEGLRVLMVSIDTEPEGQKAVQELIEQNQVTFPVLKDRFNLVARRWLGPKSPLPSVFIVRPDGTVAAVHRGYSEGTIEAIAAAVERALEGGKTGAPKAEKGGP